MPFVCLHTVDKQTAYQFSVLQKIIKICIKISVVKIPRKSVKVLVKCFADNHALLKFNRASACEQPIKFQEVGIGKKIFLKWPRRHCLKSHAESTRKI